MQETLFVHLSTQRYGSYAETGKLIQSGSYAELSPPPKSIRVALVANEDVLLTQAILPRTTLAKLLQAVPYAIEDQVVDNIEHLYFAVGKQDTASGSVPVAVSKQALVSAWLDQLHTLAFFSVKYLLPEALALFYVPRQWQILLTQQTAIIRQDEYRGTTVALTQLPLILKLWLQEGLDLPTQINLSYTHEHAELTLTLLADIGVPVVIAAQASTVEAEFARGLAQGLSDLNLLQSAGKLRNNRVPWSQQWQWALYAMVVVFLSSQIGSLLFLQYRNRTAQQHVAALYFSAYPQDTALVAPRARINDSLVALNNVSGGAFLSGIVAIGKQLSAQGYVLTINRIDFRADVFSLEVSALDFPTLATFNRALIGQGYQIDQSNARSEAGQVSAKLAIKKAKL